MQDNNKKNAPPMIQLSEAMLTSMLERSAFIGATKALAAAGVQNNDEKSLREMQRLHGAKSQSDWHTRSNQWN